MSSIQDGRTPGMEPGSVDEKPAIEIIYYLYRIRYFLILAPVVASLVCSVLVYSNIRHYKKFSVDLETSGTDPGRYEDSEEIAQSVSDLFQRPMFWNLFVFRLSSLLEDENREFDSQDFQKALRYREGDSFIGKTGFEPVLEEKGRFILEIYLPALPQEIEPSLVSNLVKALNIAIEKQNARVIKEKDAVARRSHRVLDFRFEEISSYYTAKIDRVLDEILENNKRISEIEFSLLSRISKITKFNQVYNDLVYPELVVSTKKSNEEDGKKLAVDVSRSLRYMAMLKSEGLLSEEENRALGEKLSRLSSESSRLSLIANVSSDVTNTLRQGMNESMREILRKMKLPLPLPVFSPSEEIRVAKGTHYLDHQDKLLVAVAAFLSVVFTILAGLILVYVRDNRSLLTSMIKKQ